MDFDRDDLAAEMRRAGFDPSRRVLALWSGIPRGRTEEFLAEHGLELVDDIGMEEATARYLIGSDGRPAARLWEFGGVARARVGSG